jgi:Cellulase (glycosyl hydrolase family 5)
VTSIEAPTAVTRGGDLAERVGSPPVRRSRVRPRRRRWVRRCVVLGSVLGLLAAVTVAVGPRPGGRTEAVVCGSDAVQSAALAGLADYASWLQANQVAGYVGEIGWPSGPDADRWAAAADTWYRAADRIGLPVTAWAAARWPADYRMAVYRAGPGASGLDRAGPQSVVVQRHASSDRYLRGVVLAGGSFGTSDADPDFSGAQPGRFGYDYTYENGAGYRYLARQGVRLVRLAVVWERLQPVPGGPLRDVEIARVRRAVRDAAAAGLHVIIDLHGYGDFTASAGAGGARTVLSLGSPQLPTTALADLWSRTSRATRDLPGLLGYDLMNEPVRLAGHGPGGERIWEVASQESADAIRAAGSTARIFVAAYGRTSPTGWVGVRPWLRDPARRVVYEAHVYFDADGSGRYADSYAGTAARAGVAPRCQYLPDLSALQAKALGGSPWLLTRVRDLVDRFALSGTVRRTVS